MASSSGGRSYSDQSYGSVKTIKLGPYTAGTRATALVDTFQALNPITILDWELSNAVLGTGGSSQWVIAATGASGTAALGTISCAGTHAIGAVVSGTATETKLVAGEKLNLYSVLSTAADLSLTAVISYREHFVTSDN